MLRASIGLWLSGCAPASSPPAPRPISPPPPPAPCASPQADLAYRALEAGHLERARRLFLVAAQSCPASPADRRALLSTLVTLGRTQDAADLAEEIQQDPSAPEDERLHARELVASVPPVRITQALAWVREGIETLDRDDPRAGRWLLDRALVALERDQPAVTLSLPNGPLGTLPWRHPTRSPLARRSKPVLAASEDGKLLAFGEGQIVRVVDTTSGQEVNALPLRGTSARAVALSPPAGPLRAVELAVLCNDRTLKLWNLLTGRERQLETDGAVDLPGYTAAGRLRIEGDGWVDELAPQGKRQRYLGKLRGHDRAGHLLLEQGAKLVLQGSTRGPWSAPKTTDAVLAPDGSWLAVAGTGGRSVEVIPLREGLPLKTLQAPRMQGLKLVAASASGERLLAALPGQTVVWDVSDGTSEQREGWKPVGFAGETALLEQDNRWALWRPGASAPRELQERTGDRFRELLAAGPLLLSQGSHELVYQLRDPQSGAPLKAIDPLHAEALQAPSLLGTEALAGVEPDGSVRLIWPERGEQAHLSTAGSLTLGVAFEGDALSAFSEGQLRQFDRQTGQQTSLRERPLVGKQFGAFRGRFLATLAPHGWLQLFDLASGHSHKTLEGSRLQETFAVALSEDGRWAAASERSGLIRVWDTERGGEPLRLLEDHRLSVHAMAFVDARRLCSGDESGNVFCRDLPDGSPTALQPTTPLGDVAALDRTEEGELLVVSRSLLGVRVRVFEHAQGKQLRSLGELLPIDGEGAVVRGGVLLAPSTLSGSTLLMRVADGAPLGVLRVLRNGKGAYFLAPSGGIELMGTTLGEVGACRIGHRSFPSALCQDRFDTPGLLRCALAGGVC